jgi:hypothetical protein
VQVRTKRDRSPERGRFLRNDSITDIQRLDEQPLDKEKQWPPPNQAFRVHRPSTVPITIQSILIALAVELLSLFLFSTFRELRIKVP